MSIGPHSDHDVRWGMEMRLLAEQGTRRDYERIIRTPQGTLTARHSLGFDPKDPTLGFETEYFVKSLDDWRIVIAYWEAELNEAGLPSHEDIDEAAAAGGGYVLAVGDSIGPRADLGNIEEFVAAALEYGRY